MTTPTETVNDMFARLSPQALLEYSNFILSRTPPELQGLMVTKIDASGPPPPLTATQVIITNDDDVVVNDLADDPVAGSPGVATVAAGVLTKVNLTV